MAPDVRWVAVGGVPLLSFLVALAGAMLARAVMAGLGSGSRVEWRWLPAALAAVVTGGLVLAGGLLPVDPGGARRPLWWPRSRATCRRPDPAAQLNDTQVTQNHVTATIKLAGQVKAGQRPAPTLAVWPEDSVGIDPNDDPVPL